jgi:putative transcriptional regulator
MITNDHKRLSNQVRQLRIEHGGLTQAELGKRVDCTRQTIIAIEAGGYVPSLTLAFRIARVFDLPIDRVFQYKDK